MKTLQRLAVAALLAALPVTAQAVTLIDDPLHIQCAGCIDNGTNTPLPTNASIFGFSSSPPGAGGVLWLEVLVPNNTINPLTFIAPAINSQNAGFGSGIPSLFSITPWLAGTQNAYLGGAFNLNASPDNGIGAYLPSTQGVDPGATGFFSFLFNAGAVGAGGLGGPGDPLVDLFKLGGNLPDGSYIIAMLLTLDKDGNPVVINTANSGAGFINQLQSPVPIPGAIWLFGGGLAGVWALSRRKKKQADAKLIPAA